MDYYDFLGREEEQGKSTSTGLFSRQKAPSGKPFVMHEGASSGVKSSGSTSLQEFVSTEVTYSNGDMIVALQEVLSKRLQFHNGTYSKLLDSIKFILDNLQAAFTRNHCNLFQKTL